MQLLLILLIVIVVDVYFLLFWGASRWGLFLLDVIGVLILLDLREWLSLLLWLADGQQRLLLLNWSSYFLLLLDRIGLWNLNGRFCWAFERMVSCLVKLYIWLFLGMRDRFTIYFSNKNCLLLWLFVIDLLKLNILFYRHSFTLNGWFYLSHLYLWKLLTLILCCNNNFLFLCLLFCFIRVDDRHYWLVCWLLAS